MSDYSDLLEFIQKSGAKILELEETIAQLERENGNLKSNVSRLEGKLETKKEQIKNLSDIADNWHSRYSEIHREKGQLEDTVEVLTNAIAILSPKLSEEIKEDLGEDMFSDLLNYTKRRNGFYF